MGLGPPLPSSSSMMTEPGELGMCVGLVVALLAKLAPRTFAVSPDAAAEESNRANEALIA